MNENIYVNLNRILQYNEHIIVLYFGGSVGDAESYVVAQGLNVLSRSFDPNQRAYLTKYLDENFQDIPYILEYVDDKVLVEIMNRYRNEFREWVRFRVQQLEDLKQANSAQE